MVEKNENNWNHVKYDELDLLDKKIMYELDLNSRISASQLAKKLRKSKETVNFRINRLIKNKFIKGFYSIFNTSKLGYYYVKFYIKFRNITPEKENQIIDYVSKKEKIAYLASVEGKYDCFILLMIRNFNEVSVFQDDFMKLYGGFIQDKDIVIFLNTHRFNSKFLYEGTEKKDWNYQIELENYNLDEIDKGILKIISTNSKISLIDIAEKLKIDQKVVKYRIKKLEKDNIIFAYVTSPDFDKLGLSFFQVNISLKNSNSRKKIIKFFEETNKCLFAMELIGKYDLLVELHLENNEQLKRIIDDFREKFIQDYADYDVSTITKEHVMVWSPF